MIIVSYLFSSISFINSASQSPFSKTTFSNSVKSFIFSCFFESLCIIKALIIAVIINFVKQGDKSSISNLNNDNTHIGFCVFMIRFIIFHISVNFLSIEGSITLQFWLNSGLNMSKCCLQHISLYLFLS